MSVGVTRMPSAWARSGSRNTSTTSISYRSGRCNRHSAVRLASACAEFCVPSAVYSLNLNTLRRFMTCSSPGFRRVQVSAAKLPEPPAALGYLAFVAGGGAGQQRLLHLLRHQFGLQRFQAHLQFALFGGQRDAPELTLHLGDIVGETLGALFFPPQRAHQHVAARRIDVGQGYTRIAEDQFAHLVRVRRAAGLDDGQLAIPLTR